MRLILSALSYCSRPYVADPKKHDDDGDDDDGDDDDHDDGCRVSTEHSLMRDD